VLEGRDLAVGMVVLAVVLGACALPAWVVVARGMPWLRGEARALALGVAFTAAVVGVHLVPGALGVFVPGAVVIVALAAAGLVAWRVRGASADADATDRERIPWWAWAAPLVLAGCALALLRDLAGAPVTSIDAQNFQVPIVARWIQGDSLWGLHQFIADYSNATYPQNGNLLVAAVMLPFDSAFLARLVAAPYWAMAALGVYAIARELNAPKPGAMLAGTAFAALPVMAKAGLEGVQTDAPMLACLAAGVLFLLRHHRTGERRELIVAGVALGLAFGTKWYAVTGVAAILAVWLAGRRRLWPDAGVVIGLIAAAGGFWMLRNLVEAGNPMFPQPLGPFPAPPDPLREQGGFTLAHYAFDFDVWRTYLKPAFAQSFGWTGAILTAAALLAAGLRPKGPVRAVAIGALVLAALYAVTPYSAFGPEGRPVLAAASTRYGLPALMGAAVLAAWATRNPRLRLGLHVLLAAAVLDGVNRAFELGAGKVIGGCVAALLLGLAAVRLPRRAVAAATLAGALLLVPMVAHRANRQGFGQFDPALAWIEANAPSGHRIGLAGVWTPGGVSPVLPAFGPRLGNRVAYAGPFVEHMLRTYADQPAFTAGTRSFDLLVVGLTPPARELGWAQAAGFTEVVRSERLVLLRRAIVGRR
jgi:hypothetical protein